MVQAIQRSCRRRLCWRERPTWRRRFTACQGWCWRPAWSHGAWRWQWAWPPGQFKALSMDLKEDRSLRAQCQFDDLITMMMILRTRTIRRHWRWQTRNNQLGLASPRSPPVAPTNMGSFSNYTAGQVIINWPCMVKPDMDMVINIINQSFWFSLPSPSSLEWIPILASGRQTVSVTITIIIIITSSTIPVSYFIIITMIISEQWISWELGNHVYFFTYFSFPFNQANWGYTF